MSGGIPDQDRATEPPIELVRGTRDLLPAGYARLAGLEALLLDRFHRAGYEPLRTPALEHTELHERKSGAGIVARLFELAPGTTAGRVCLRPELTAGIVRAYLGAAESPALPWRVSHAGSVFRHETSPDSARLREFSQVGVELLGASGPVYDGELIWLASWALNEAGIDDGLLRLGHAGLILEMLGRSGLPPNARAALVEMLSEAATEGRSVQALESGLEQLAGWLQAAESTGEIPLAVDRADDSGIDRLFRTLVPVVIGRRSGHEVVHRLRRKWDLGHSLHGVLQQVRGQVHTLADLKGPPTRVLPRLEREFGTLAPDSVAALKELCGSLADYGVDLDRVELDLGFGRGIGFYTQMIFELVVPTPDGPVEVGGGGRYDGLARVLGSDRDDRGVGFAFGLERLGQVLDARRATPPAPTPRGILVVAAGPGRGPDAVRLATYLRTKGARAVVETDRPIRAALEHAARLGLARAVEVAGPLEETGALTLHELATGIKAEVAPGDLARIARDEAEGRNR